MKRFLSEYKRTDKILHVLLLAAVIVLFTFTVRFTAPDMEKPLRTPVSPGEDSDIPLSGGETEHTEETIPAWESSPEEETAEPVVYTIPAATVPDEETESETAVTTTIQEPGDDTDAAAIVSSIMELDAKFPSAVLKKTDDMGEDYIRRIVFVGDSTTYALKRYGVLEGGKNTTQVWTPASGTLTLSSATIATIVYPEDGSEITIAEAAARKKPDIIVVTLGINGISFMKEDYFKSSYTALINEIRQASPDSKIILQSIFPVAASYASKKSINNTKIAAANEWIASIAEELGLKFANTASVLIGSTGYLPEEYQNGDGLHLNGVALDLELQYLRTHALPDDAEPESTDSAENGENVPHE